MMFSIAYFESFFAPLFQWGPPKSVVNRQVLPSKTCIDRWEDEGGATRRFQPRSH